MCILLLEGFSVAVSISTEVTTPLQFTGVTKLAEKRVKSGVCRTLVIAALGRLMQGDHMF